MPLHQTRLALALLAVSLMTGASVSRAESLPAAQRQAESFVQPFLTTFERHDSHVIAFLAEHPEYEAIEAMVTRKEGQPPRIRAILSLRGGFQIDFFNDAAVARERAATLTQRLTFYRPIQYEESEVEGIPTMKLGFTSHRGEAILLHFQANSRPLAERGGFINPGARSGEAALPVMWASTSALASPATGVRINGVSHPLSPGLEPGTTGAIYSRGFLIGVFRAGTQKLILGKHSVRLAVGERWVSWDQVGNQHRYEIIDITGGLLTIHKTSTSTFLPEEIITARAEGGELVLQSLRATGRIGLQDSVPPPHEGFTLDLSVAGHFSLSLDEHTNLVTGTASVQNHGATKTWRISPSQPSWATNRVETASAARHWNWYFITNSIGAP